MKRLLWRIKGKHFRIFYAASRFIGSILRHFDRSEPKTDLVFVVPEYQRGWILEGIAKEIARYFSGSHSFHYSIRSLPRAKAYFFVHYGVLPIAYQINPSLWNRKVFVWYTHPRGDLGVSDDELHYALEQAQLVFCTCTQFVRLLQSTGVERAATVLGGADPALFHPRKRGGGKVGFCTAYYPRKSPETILGVVRRMPHRDFLLVGRNWRQYERFAELQALANLQYVEAPYEDYPALYGQMDVFVSVSRLEGGPIPLIEAMMCNVVPVASRTGFAPDLIRHGENGFLFDVDANPQAICSLIDEAMELDADVRTTVERYSWSDFASQVETLMGFGRASRAGTSRDNAVNVVATESQ